jgi:hypothetical protein
VDMKQPNNERREKMEKQKAMATYWLTFELIDGKNHRYVWEDMPSKYLAVRNYPYQANGVMFRYGYEHKFVPWHQIKQASLKEELMWDDNKKES